MKLVLYKTDWCPYCQRVAATIRRLGLDVELRDRDEPRWRADLVARTGRTQVPCLLIDDAPMFESADIIRYLEGVAKRA